MAQASMKVERVKDSGIRNWFKAIGSVNGFKVHGFGNTHKRAIEEAFKTYWSRWGITKDGFIRI